MLAINDGEPALDIIGLTDEIDTLGIGRGNYNIVAGFSIDNR